MNTKEKILWEALELFSRRGYGAVSVREIAGAVGIRESSLYNHFAGKQEIFDEIVDICWGKAEEYYHSRSLPFAPEDELGVFQRPAGELEGTLLEVFRYFFEDPWNVRFRRLLTVSQFENPRVGELYRQLYGEYPMRVQRAVFASLMAAGEFPQGDPDALALEFYGGVFLLINLAESWGQARPRLIRHIRLFREQNQKLKGKEEKRG